MRADDDGGRGIVVTLVTQCDRGSSATHSERYLILPDLSISSVGPVASVLLFSRVPVEELDGREILLSAESATSVNLLRILLSKRFGHSCRYTVSSGPLTEALRTSPAMLLSLLEITARQRGGRFSGACREFVAPSAARLSSRSLFERSRG